MPRNRREIYLRDREKEIANSRSWHQRNRERWNAGRREYRKRLKAAVFERYGNRCIHCNNQDARVLQIDHVKANGNEERRTLFNTGSSTYLKKVFADAEGNYQLLCANCNLIKYHEVDRELQTRQ